MPIASEQINNINIFFTMLLKQSLMEFNNAISHICNALMANEVNENINRAISHLYRGSLDFYKAIIKDLSFLSKIDNRYLKEIMKIRELEYK